MFKQISNWYKNRKTLERLLITLIFWCLFWTIIDFLLILDSVGESILTGIFMGIIWTCSFDWKLVKKAFTKTNNNERSA